MNNAVPFQSILFNCAEDGIGVDDRAVPPFFVDLNIDQVIEPAIAGRDEYNLKPFFNVPLHSVDAITYRHEVLRDLQDDTASGHVAEFAKRMRAMRGHLAQLEELHYRYQREAWFLDAVRVYCDAVERLADDLTATQLGSRGLQTFREYLHDYAGSAQFTSLLADADGIAHDLGKVRYCVNIRGSRVTVSRYEGETDYSAQVEMTFAKFKQGAVRSYLSEFGDRADMNHVEAQVLDLVAKLHPGVFSRLDAFWEHHQDFLDAAVARFDREVQFYVAYLEHMTRLECAGLAFSFPHVSTSKLIRVRETEKLSIVVDWP